MRGDKVVYADSRVYLDVNVENKRPDINQLKKRAVEEQKKDKKKTILIIVAVASVLIVSTLMLRL